MESGGRQGGPWRPPFLLSGHQSSSASQQATPMLTPVWGPRDLVEGSPKPTGPLVWSG